MLALIILIITIVVMIAPAWGQRRVGPVRESDILVWNTSTSKWQRITKGDFLAAVARGATVTQTTETGVGFTVSRDKAAAATDAALAYILNDNAGDDQAALIVRQDGTGDIFSLLDGATERLEVADLGLVTLTTGATTQSAFHVNASTVTSGDGIKVTIVDGTMNGGTYIKCTDGAATDFSVGEGGAVACGGNTTVGGTLGVTGAATIPVLGTVAIDASAGNVTLTAATHGGKVLIVTGVGAPELTLPPNATTAGTWIRIMNAGTDATEPVYKSAVADTLIAPNDAGADSVTFGSGHRIGSCVLFIATGAGWVVINESTGCTMTITS